MLLVSKIPAMCFLHGNYFKNPCVLCGALAYCCGAVAPRAIAALLGRFLPRLGPLAFASGPFFFLERLKRLSGRPERATGRPELTRIQSAVRAILFRGGLERAEIAERNGGERVGQRH